MLDHNNRLLKKKDFDAVYRYGRSFYRENITIKVLKSKEDVSRIGLIISTKFSKKAVERNKMKRKLREIVRLNLEKIKAGFDIVIMIRKTEKEQEYQKLEAILNTLLQKANILK